MKNPLVISGRVITPSNIAKLKAYARNLSTEWGDDYLQQSLMKAWQKQPQHPITYISRSIKNAHLDRVKLTSEKMTEHPETVPETQEQTQPEIVAVLAALHPLERIIIIARYNGMEFGEMATGAGISERTVRRVVHTLQAKCRLMIEHD